MGKMEVASTIIMDSKGGSWRCINEETHNMKLVKHINHSFVKATENFSSGIN